jgi:RND family efflux transporter MFP subunit
VLVVIALVFIGLAAVAYLGSIRPNEARPTASPVASSPFPTSAPVTSPPRTAAPRRTPTPTPVDTSIVASAVVLPERSAELSIPVGGRVDAILVEEQEDVTTGQVLLRLDDDAQHAALGVATSSQRRAQAAVDRARAQLDALPEDASPLQLEALQAELRLAEAELTLARAAVNEAEVAVRLTELRAPFSGTVVAIHVGLGEQAPAGSPVATIADLSSWFIETTDLSELDVVRIAVGDPASITFEALPGLVLQGSVERIQVRGMPDQGRTRFDVAIRPAEHRPELRWNMSATVRISPGR